MPLTLIDEIKERLLRLKCAFMRDAAFQGTHFRYAKANGERLIERKHLGRFYYWLDCDAGMYLIDASIKSKFPGMQTVGDVFPDGNVGHVTTS